MRSHATTTPFGPQLIGETEKILGAVLRRHLLDERLSEPEWVSLRLAGQLDHAGNGYLAAAVADRAHVDDAPTIVAALVGRGLVADGRLTDQGQTLLRGVQASVAAATGGIWQGLPDDDVAAVTRVLNEVASRARHVLESA